MAIIAIVVILVGCWDMKEIDKRLFVGVMGVDRASRKKYLVNFSCPVVREIAGGEGGGGGGGKTKPAMTVSTTSETIMDAIRSMALRLNRSLFFEHMRVLVIGEDVAREDLKPILNTFIRRPQFNRRSHIVIAHGTAEDVLEVEPWVEKLKANYIDSLYQNSSLTGRFVDMTLGEFLNRLHAYDGNLLASRIVPDEEQVNIGGASVIKNYKLVGWLSEEETQGANFFLGRIRGGDIVVYSKEKDCYITFLISKAKKSLQLTSYDDVPRFLLKVFVEGNIASTSEGTVIDMESINKIEKLIEQQVKSQINMAINKTQKQFKVDILDVGDTLYKFYPDVWAKYKDEWQDIYPNVDIDVEVYANIKNIGAAE